MKKYCMELGKLFSKICESSLITSIYHLKRGEKTKTIVKCSYISEHHGSDLTSTVSTNGQVTHYWTTLHRILLSSNLSLFLRVNPCISYQFGIFNFNFKNTLLI